METLRQETNSDQELRNRLLEMEFLVYIAEAVQHPGITIPTLLQDMAERTPGALFPSENLSLTIEFEGTVYGPPVGTQASSSIRIRLSLREHTIEADDVDAGSCLRFTRPGDLDRLERFIGHLQSAIEKITCHQALRNHQGKLGRYLENAPDGIFITDASGRYIEVNPAACQITGYTQAELLSMAISDLSAPEARDEGGAAFKALLETGSDRREIALKRKDGSRVHVTLDSIRLPDGTCMGFCRDISDRVTAERKIEELLSFYEVLLDTVPLPVFYKDTRGRYLGSNRSYARFLGTPAHGLEGKTVFDVVPQAIARVHQEKDKDLLENLHQQVYESQVWDADGTLRDVICHKSTFSNADGQTAGIIGVLVDITERKKTERELSLYFKAVQSLEQPVVITDRDGLILQINTAVSRIYGYTKEEMLGKDTKLLNPGRAVYKNYGYTDEEYEKLFSGLWQAILDPEGGTWENVVINRKKNGALIWVSLLVSAVYNESHEIQYFIGLPVDISRHRQRENQSKGQLLQTISALAELRDEETGNHMRRVGIYAKLLARALEMPEKYCEDIELFAPMHDIGKVGILDSILLAERSLTKEEFQIIKTHTTLGYNIVKGKTDLDMVAGIVLSHHERFDGSGYPQGLRGTQIPLAARITTIADVYDALRSRRPYKKPWPHEQAMGYMESNSGTQFDPELIRLLSGLHLRFNAIYTELEDE